jgi:tetratricopeptide (TPR) repeat protein
LREDEDFEFFVCYYERGAEDIAERIYEVLAKDRSASVYVDHVLRKYQEGRFGLQRDEIIKKCRVFILLNTYSALARTEVIREVQTAYPNGIVTNHEFWIFRENHVAVSRGTREFAERTGIQLEKYTQHDFSTLGELTRILLVMYDYRKKSLLIPEKTMPLLTPQSMLSHLARTKSIAPSSIVSSTDSITVNPDDLREKAETAFEKGDYAKSLELYDQILDNFPSDISSINRKGMLLSLLKCNDEAVLEFSSAIYLNPHIMELWANKSLALCYGRHFKEALACIDRALKISSKESKHLALIKAIILFGLGDYQKSKEWFDKVLASDHKSSPAITGKAVVLSKLGFRKETYELLHEAIVIDPHNANAWYNLAVMYEEDRKYHEALIHFMRATELDEKDYRSFTYMGTILQRLSRYEEALRAYDRAIVLEPNSVGLYVNKATALGFMGKFQESLEYLDKALSIDPKSTNAIINKAESLRQLNRLDEALPIILGATGIGGQNVVQLILLHEFTTSKQSM